MLPLNADEEALYFHGINHRLTVMFRRWENAIIVENRNLRNRVKDPDRTRCTGEGDPDQERPKRFCKVK